MPQDALDNTCTIALTLSELSGDAPQSVVFQVTLTIVAQKFQGVELPKAKESLPVNEVSPRAVTA